MSEIEIESFQGENLEEGEMGQRHAEHLNQNAIEAVRARIGSGPSAEECDACGATIPEARRLAVAGCRLCIECKSASEGKRR